VHALVGHDGDERFDDLLLVLAGDEADVTTWQGRRIAAIVATLTDAQITELCEAYDLCPLHRRDIDICGEEQEQVLADAQAKTGEDWLRARELSFQQSVVLRYLVDNPGVIQRDIVQLTRTTEASVSSLLRGLERRGLVERRTEAASARSKRVYPTPAGVALADGLDESDGSRGGIDPGTTGCHGASAFSAILSKITAQLPTPPRS
jgi:MarR family transcriptional repressor of mepA